MLSTDFAEKYHMEHSHVLSVAASFMSLGLFRQLADIAVGVDGQPFIFIKISERMAQHLLRDRLLRLDEIAEMLSTRDGAECTRHDVRGLLRELAKDPAIAELQIGDLWSTEIIDKIPPAPKREYGVHHLVAFSPDLTPLAVKWMLVHLGYLRSFAGNFIVATDVYTAGEIRYSIPGEEFEFTKKVLKELKQLAVLD